MNIISWTLLWQKPWQSFYKSSWEVILKIMFLYYKPMKHMVIIYITTSIIYIYIYIYIFKAHGKYSIPQAYHLNYDVIIRNHEHYLWYGIQHSKCYLQRHFETYAIISNVTTHCPKAHYKCLWKPKYLLIIKVHEGWKPSVTCVVNVHFVGWTQPSLMGLAHMSKPSPKNPNKKQRIENG